MKLPLAGAANTDREAAGTGRAGGQRQDEGFLTTREAQAGVELVDLVAALGRFRPQLSGKERGHLGPDVLGRLQGLRVRKSRE